jgi:hypothetical protein
VAIAARRGPRAAGNLARRQTNGEPEIVALSWKAQRRLHHVWTRMEQRHKRRTITAVAAARTRRVLLGGRNRRLGRERLG